MPEVQYAHNGDVQLAYETFGDLANGKPLLLIMGLDFQMVWWPDDFCQRLVEDGYAVVRYDNRDTGLSTKFDSDRKENAWRALLGGTTPAYSAMDMVDDGIAVMDAVGWQSANIMGASMGAGLAQGIAAQYPDRTRSLISAYGMPIDVGRFEVMKYLKFGWFPKMARLKPGKDRDSEIHVMLSIIRMLNGSTYELDEQWATEAAGISYDRSPRDPKSTQRQVAARNSGEIPSLSSVTAPTLVFAGDADPMIKLRAGEDTAKRIKGAQFVSYPGMGHVLPREVWDDVIFRMDQITS